MVSLPAQSLPSAQWVPQPYSRAERLLNLLMALRHTSRPLGRAEIRSQVRGYDPQASEESFTRMFERDKEDLRSMGIEVRAVRDPNGVVLGYRASAGGLPGDLQLDRDELAVLALAVRLWERTNLGPAARNALAKLESRLGLVVGGAKGGQPDLGAAAAGFAGAATAVAELVAAVSRGQRVSFSYRKPAGPVTRREVDPWRVLWWRGGWYLVGWDHDRGATRVYRISRIVGDIAVRGKPGAVQAPVDLDARELIGRFAADRPGRALVALAPGRGASLRRQGRPLEPAEIARVAARVPDRAHPADWDLIAVDYQELPAIVSAICAQAGAACILEPPALRQAVAGALSAVLAGLATPKAAQGRVRPKLDVVGGSSQAQFARMLALVPWLARNSGVSVSAAAEHFGVSPAQLMADLGSVITSGIDDWTLFDIQYWDADGEIRMIDPLDLDEPLALAPDELLAVTVAAQALAGLPGRESDPAVGRLLHKLAGAAPHLQAVVDVRPEIPRPIADVVARARAGHRTIDLRYLAATRDEETQRTVDPVEIVVVDGHSYLLAHCRRAGDARYFRLDRILHAEVGGQPAREIDLPAAMPMSQRLASTGNRAILDLSPAGQVLAERHPIADCWDLPDGWLRVQMPYADPSWLCGLVLAGNGAVVLREPVEVAEAVRGRATMALRMHE